jgi:hypothetical protein
MQYFTMALEGTRGTSFWTRDGTARMATRTQTEPKTGKTDSRGQTPRRVS